MSVIFRSSGYVALIWVAAVAFGCSSDDEAGRRDPPPVASDTTAPGADTSLSKSDAAPAQTDVEAQQGDAAPSEADTSTPARTIRLDDWSGGSFVFVVDRAWQNPGAGGPGFPHDELDEEDYVPVEDGPRHDVVVSEDGARVELGETPMVGERHEAGASRIAYNLSEGLFAGGRFVVWEVEAGLEAELTIYGSGVPIVSSERGAIVDAGADPR